MERKLEEGHQEIKDSGYELSEDGLTLLKVTNEALDGNGHFTIPEGVTSIGAKAFWRCVNLTTVHIPDSVTFVGDLAFDGCTRLTTVHIPEGVTFVGHCAFSYCTSLTTIHIPDSVTFVGDLAFIDCTSLTTVHIPEGVTSIGAGAFRGCTRLTTVHIPEGVTFVENCAFSYCTSLTTIHIPDSVTFVGDLAFIDCTSLTNIIIDTDDEAELNRIKNLLPENLRDKVISRSVYEIQRGMVDRFIFEAAGGDHFNDILHSLGLIVKAVNKIIASYLPGPVGHILGIIDRVGIPACLPNAESKETYRELLAQSIGRELLAQSIGRVFPNFNAAQANDQKQAGTDDIKQVGPVGLLVEDQGVDRESQNDAQGDPFQGQQGSTPVPGLFQPVAQTPGTTQAAPQPVAPTRGQRPEQETNMCCVMQ